MKRKQVYIRAAQDQRLRALARRQGKTESHLFREGVDRILAEPLPQALNHQAWLKSRKFIDSLIRRGPVRGGGSWTREEAHERQLPLGKE